MKNFSNKKRPSVILPVKKTGTTITGLVFDKGLILGADTRATNGIVSVDNNCQKIHYLAPKNLKTSLIPSKSASISESSL